MAEFQFKNNLLELVIAGQTFVIDPIEAAVKLPRFAGELEEASKSMGDTHKEAVRACRMILDRVDKILGRKACAGIFRGRKINFYDCLDLFSFIQNEVKRFGEEKQKELTGGGEGKREIL